VTAVARRKWVSTKLTSSFTRICVSACSLPGAANFLSSLVTTIMPDAFFLASVRVPVPSLVTGFGGALAGPFHTRAADLERDRRLERQWRRGQLPDHRRLSDETTGC
jgi:hypothetical protein